MKIHNQHDALLKELLSFPENARDFLKNFLPAHIFDKLDAENVQQLKTSFINNELTEHFSDTILQCKLKNENTSCYKSILLEHKSYKDKYVCFQFFAYMAQAYLQQIKEGDDLKIVIPMVFYHGKELWELKNCRDFFSDFPEDYQIYVPHFETIFSDLVRVPDEKLASLQNKFLVATMFAQKY